MLVKFGWLGLQIDFVLFQIFARGSLNLYSNLIDQINYVDFFEGKCFKIKYG